LKIETRRELLLRVPDRYGWEAIPAFRGPPLGIFSIGRRQGKNHLSKIAHNHWFIQHALKSTDFMTATWALFEVDSKKMLHFRTQSSAKHLVADEIQEQFLTNLPTRKFHKASLLLG
jgi:hypothetical protein